MLHQLHPVTAGDYDEILTVWEAAVRATHHFLPENDILFYKKAILEEYLPSGMLELVCLKDDHGAITGFMGLSAESIEMLFIRPDASGKGLGKYLLAYAVDTLGKSKVDVNEQNPSAIGFYEHCGFKRVGRSELDGSGKAYPIIHMSR